MHLQAQPHRLKLYMAALILGFKLGFGCQSVAALEWCSLRSSLAYDFITVGPPQKKGTQQ